MVAAAAAGERHGRSRGDAGPLPRRRAGRHGVRRRRRRAAAVPHSAEVRAGSEGAAGGAGWGPAAGRIRAGRRRGGLVGRGGGGRGAGKRFRVAEALPGEGLGVFPAFPGIAPCLCVPRSRLPWEPRFKKYSERLSFLRDVGRVARISGIPALGLVVNVLLVLGTRRAVCFLRKV